jgi:hypothetical protein
MMARSDIPFNLQRQGLSFGDLCQGGTHVECFGPDLFHVAGDRFSLTIGICSACFIVSSSSVFDAVLPLSASVKLVWVFLPVGRPGIFRQLPDQDVA